MSGTVYQATVWDADGQQVWRIFKGQPVAPIVIERSDADRAWLTARGIPDKPSDWPNGVSVKVIGMSKPIPGTSLQAPDVLVYERVWDGEHWKDVATGHIVK